MDENAWLAERFEAHRAHLLGVAFRMLGSSSEADDAVQEAWLHLARAGASGVENLGGWLTTVVARVCLDMLRSRKAHREEPLAAAPPAAIEDRADGTDPEREALLADSVGLALLVVLDALAPAERIAFVLHDLFAVPFDEIAPIVGRSPEAARQLASRARRRVQGAPTVPDAQLASQRAIVAAFLAAMRNADFDGLLAVLDPDVAARSDVPHGGGHEIRGARAWAKGAIAFRAYARHVSLALVDGTVGLILAPGGRIERALRFTFKDGKIAEVDVVADPAHVRALEVAVLDG
jgi:RNA polymerase sigma-70 factor (ECF subfamily)